MSKSINKQLLEKGIEAITMAIEVYNKPLVKYRTETVTILVINAWENCLKSLILKNSWGKVYNYKTGESKPFEDCIANVKSNLGKKFSDSWVDSLDVLYKHRCNVIHYHRSLDVIDYMLIQQNILFFKEFVEQSFDQSIIKGKTWYVLPISTEVPFTEFDLITCRSSIQEAPTDIKEYFKKIVELQNNNMNKNNPSILISLNVTLQNVNRIDTSDLVIGVDNTSNTSVNVPKTVTIGVNGRAIQVTEFLETTNKYPLFYDDVIKQCKEIKRINQNEMNRFMTNVKNNSNYSFNWGTLSKILPIKVADRYTYSNAVIDLFREKYQNTEN